MEKEWVVKPEAPESFFVEHSTYPRLVAQLLFNRDFQDKEKINKFLHPDYERDVHDPFLFNHMNKAVERVYKAIDDQELIVVHGDYDADGVCGAAILCSTLEALGAKVDFFLPHREEDGYGLNENTIKKLVDRGAKLIITCDCGISDKNEVDLANENNVDVIVTDHHQIPEQVPNAYAILHPKTEDETYPDDTLSGGGVAFKFSQALLREHKKQGNETINGISHEGFEKWLLDLVAISSVADMVPLLEETRALTKFGLVVLNKTQRTGLKKLMEVARVFDGNGSNRVLGTETIGFRIAPRINAAGRMEHADEALKLLLEEDPTKAEGYANCIHNHNIARQKMTEELTKSGLKYIEENHTEKDPVLFVRGDGWSPGIVGLIASRLKDRFYKPVIVIGEANGTYVGSGRSIPQFHITEALGVASQYLSKFGGHPQACGFSLKEKTMFEDFTKAMTEHAIGILGDKTINPILELESEVHLDDIHWDLWNTLERFAPFGVGNPEPLFVTKNAIIVDVQPVGKTGKHMKLLARGQDGRKVQKFIAFSCPKWLKEFNPNDVTDIIFEIGLNEWNGRKELQLKIVDIRKSA